jgi:uncharacterized protein
VSGPASAPLCWRATATGLVLRVRVTPKSSRDEVAGLTGTADGPALAVRVRAVPEDGAANKAVELAVATWLGLPKSTLAVSAGTKSRVKSVTLMGDAATLAKLLMNKLNL